jgi:hypothetical protein
VYATPVASTSGPLISVALSGRGGFVAGTDAGAVLAVSFFFRAACLARSSSFVCCFSAARARNPPSMALTAADTNESINKAVCSFDSNRLALLWWPK